MPRADDERGRKLAERARQFLVWLRTNELKDIPGSRGLRFDEVRLFAGIYRRIERQPMAPRWVPFYAHDEDRKRIESLRLGVDYALMISPLVPDLVRKLGIVAPPTNSIALAPGFTTIDTTGSLIVNRPLLDSVVATPDLMTFWHATVLSMLRGRVDLAWDDAETAQRMGFLYPQLLHYEVERTAFERQVRDIIPPEQLEAGSLSMLQDRIEKFHEYLHQNATYTEDEGEYYAKWSAKQPRRAEEREYRPALLSDTYLRENFDELRLKKGDDYILIDIGAALLVYRLLDGRRPGDVTVQLMRRFDVFAVGPDTAPPLPIHACVFHALDGENEVSADPVTAIDLAQQPSQRFIYDFTAAVRWYFGHSLPGSDDDLVEVFVRVLFPERSYVIDTSHVKYDHQLLVAKTINALAQDFSPELRDRLRDKIERYTAKPSTLVLIQGMTVGPVDALRQVIGVRRYFDRDFIYEWFPKDGIVTRMPVSLWLYETYIAALADDVYRDSCGMLPYIELVTWGGVIVMGGELVAPGALGELAVDTVREAAADLVTKQITRTALRALAAPLVAVLADGVLALLPDTDQPVLELVHGFIHGFGVLAIEHYISEIDDRLLSQLPKLWDGVVNKLTGGAKRLYGAYEKLSSAIAKLEKLYELVHQFWSAEHRRRLLAALESMGTSVGGGVLFVLLVLAYVDHAHREAQKDAAARDAWVKKQRDALIAMLKASKDGFKHYCEQLRADRDKPPSRDELRARNEALAASLVDELSARIGQLEAVNVLLEGVLGQIGVENLDQLKQLGLGQILLRGAVAVLQSPVAMRSVGEAIGLTAGTIVVERGILPEEMKTWSFAFRATPLDRATKKILAGGTMRALWIGALQLFDWIRDLIPGVSRDVADLISERDDRLLHLKDRDTSYRGLLRALLEDESRLAQLLSNLAAEASLPAALGDLFARADIDQPPDIDDLLGDDEPGWPRAAVLFVMATWLRFGLRALLEAFAAFEDDASFDGKFRLSQLIEIIGIDVSLDDKDVADLRAEFKRSR